MLTPKEQMEIIKAAIVSDYRGNVTELLQQAAVKKQQQQQQQQQQQRASGGLVQSYESTPPSLETLPVGEPTEKVEDNLGQYKHGGSHNTSDDKNAFIDQYLQNENTSTTSQPINNSILSNTISTTQGSKYYKSDGSPMTFEDKNILDTGNKEATKKHIIQANEDITEFITDPVKAGDAVGMTGIPVVSELGDLVSATASTVKGNYVDAGLSLSGIALPFAGGAALKQGKSLFKVVDAKDLKQAEEFAGGMGSGRRTGDEMTRIQQTTPFDNASATTDQSWITGNSEIAGGDNLFDRYGGRNPYVAKVHPKSLKTASTFGKDIGELAKIEPGSITNMNVSGPGGRNITNVIGPKGAQVLDVEEVLSKADYLKRFNADPNFKWKKGGIRQTFKHGGVKEEQDEQSWEERAAGRLNWLNPMFVAKRIINQVPLNVRQFGYDLLGGTGEVTIDDLNHREKKALAEARARAQAAGRNYINYLDWDTQEEGESVFQDVDSSQNKIYSKEKGKDEFGLAPLKKILNPSYSLKTTFGRIGFSKNDDDTYTYTDAYDFNNADGGGVEGMKEDIKTNGLNLYGNLRALAVNFGSQPGEGSPISLTFKKGGLKRIKKKLKSGI